MLTSLKKYLDEPNPKTGVINPFGNTSRRWKTHKQPRGWEGKKCEGIIWEQLFFIQTQCQTLQGQASYPLLLPQLTTSFIKTNFLIHNMKSSVSSFWYVWRSVSYLRDPATGLKFCWGILWLVTVTENWNPASIMEDKLTMRPLVMQDSNFH